MLFLCIQGLSHILLGTTGLDDETCDEINRTATRDDLLKMDDISESTGSGDSDQYENIDCDEDNSNSGT